MNVYRECFKRFKEGRETTEDASEDLPPSKTYKNWSIDREEVSEVTGIDKNGVCINRVRYVQSLRENIVPETRA